MNLKYLNLENHEHQFSKIQTLDDDIISHLEEDPVEEELLKSLQEKAYFILF